MRDSPTAYPSCRARTGPRRSLSTRLHWSAAVFIALVTVEAALVWFAPTVAGPSQAWMLGLLTAGVLLGSIWLHEVAHALTARAFGARRISITLMAFGGLTEFDLDDGGPRKEMAIAAAGPAMNAALAGLFWAMLPLVDPSSMFSDALRWVARANVAIAVFNLVPLFPLDGGRVLRGLLALVSRDAEGSTIASCWLGRFGAWALAIYGLSIVADQMLAGLAAVAIGVFIDRGAADQLAEAADDAPLARFQPDEAPI